MRNAPGSSVQQQVADTLTLLWGRVRRSGSKRAGPENVLPTGERLAPLVSEAPGRQGSSPGTISASRPHSAVPRAATIDFNFFFFLCDGTARGLSRRMGIFRKRTASPKGLLCVLSMTVEASRIVASITPHHFPGFSTSLFPGLVSIINRDPDLGQGVEQPLRMAALPSPRELVAVCLLLHRLLPQWCTAWRLPISSRTASPVVDWIGRDSCPPCVPGLQPINMGMGKKKLGVGDSHGLTAFFSLFVLQRIS